MRVVGVLLTVGLTGTAAVAEEARLGVAFDEREPGILASDGQDVSNGVPVRAVSRGMLVRLDHGQRLRLAANSAVLLGEGPGHDVSVTVLSGRVATVDERGRPLFGGQHSTFTLSPRSGDLEMAERLLLELDLEVSPRRAPENGDRPSARVR